MAEGMIERKAAATYFSLTDQTDANVIKRSNKRDQAYKNEANQGALAEPGDGSVTL